MWICHLGRDVHLELRVVVDLVSTYSDHFSVVFVVCLFLEDGVNGRLQGFLDIFNKDWISTVYCVFDGHQVVLLTKVDDF